MATALLLAACAPEEVKLMEFGLSISLSPGDPTDRLCYEAGRDEGGQGTIFEIDEELPHLSIYQEAAPEDQVYRVRVSVVTEYEGMMVKSEELLEQRTYDRAFGEGRNEDSISVDFKGEQHTFTIRGLPASERCDDGT
ncbi:hypothetical protein SCE1572_31915 [Sorangium cellulosum So0157-2]|uniref:Uncharacterized protein n=1 Tax=Sorangium cellulosum So0157-2 TaxID=1254432 RepID=S4Y2I2_SORCE|nr:hypothetical protein SCE1572_31915 [Sorangium cellulosum So0157-2]